MRYLRQHRWRCEVIAPSRLTRRPAEQRVKTDRRDALLLARELRAGNLTPILVPSEHSSGASRRQGAIPKCGNKHVRRILVEAAWTNRFKAHVSRRVTLKA